MTDLLNTFATYLHDVFVIKFDGWVILGFVRRILHHALRGAMDRLGTRAQERNPGGVLVLLDWRRRTAAGLRAVSPRPVFIAGQALGLLVYIRNLYFIIVNGRQSSPASEIR